jgi:hypothetical protein
VWGNEDDHPSMYEHEIKAVSLTHLNRLVESVDLINRMGDLIQAKLTKVIAEEIGYKNDADALRQAIADYESIYSNDMGDDAHKAI